MLCRTQFVALKTSLTEVINLSSSFDRFVSFHMIDNYNNRIFLNTYTS